jgi:hypothetical protein
MISRSALVPALLLASACGAANGQAETEGPAVNAASQPAGPGNAAAAGHYRLQGQHDTASELALLPNGHFQFSFAAGALDLVAQGRWTSDGHVVTLNTEPRPAPAVFSAGPVARSGGPLLIKVTNPAGRGLALVDLRLGFADGHVVEGYTQDDGWELTEGGDRSGARWVELTLRMYGLPPHRFPLDPAAGNEFTFVLTPNDLGVQDFHDTILPITRQGLILNLLGGSGVYAREH